MLVADTGVVVHTIVGVGVGGVVFGGVVDRGRGGVGHSRVVSRCSMSTMATW